jgi:4'-phosphopantetheinyl transferase EntD
VGIRTILPDGVAAAERFGDPPDVVPFPEEADAVRHAVASRRREHATVRHCARIALAELGLPPAAVLSGPNREPLWPAGIVGSMTHCDGYRAAALGRTDQFASIGIDAETHAALPDGVLGAIARADELPRLDDLAERRPDVSWDRLAFSAKESAFKAWYPLAREWLGFEEATVLIDPEGTLSVEIHRPGPIAHMDGQWLVSGGLVLTSIVIGAS